MQVNTVIQGDVTEVLKTLPDGSVNCVLTSPPYWAVRDYNVDGQIGLEGTFEEYIKKLCDVFDEVKRVLADDGTCWVNLGDTYGGGYAHSDFQDVERYSEGGDWEREPFKSDIKKPLDKCLLGIPFRFAIEMINRGWILRNTVIWHKPNCQPSPVSDRFTVDFEYIFFFVKNKKYYFQTQREPHKLESIRRACRARESDKLDSGEYAASYKNEYVGYDDMEGKLERGELRNLHPDGRNKRCVWEISNTGYSEAHFAVYCPEICETPIKAGCPEGGIVLDPFCGSGTTGVSALSLNRKFVGIELNPEYVQIALKRLKPFFEQKRLGDF
jgi:DNA modification methylase